jgi:cysteinyl-tRNA synthetase
VHNSDAAASSPAGDGTSQDAPEALARSVLAALPPEATDARADLVALLGLVEVSAEAGARQLAEQLVAALVEMRGERRTARDWAASDAIRDRLAAVGVEVQDSPAGSTWEWR